MHFLLIITIGYIATTDAYFFLSRVGTVSYDDAKIYCETLQHTLATIKSPADFQQAWLTCNNGDKSSCWLGYEPVSGVQEWTPLDGSDIGDHLGFNNDGTADSSPADSVWPWGNGQPAGAPSVANPVGINLDSNYEISRALRNTICNSCISELCTGEGKCIELAEDYQCGCEFNKCVNGGTCTDSETADEDYACVCPEGFEGAFCEVSLSEVCPTTSPTVNPTAAPTKNPTNPSAAPTKNPTVSSDSSDSNDEFGLAALQDIENNLNDGNDSETVLKIQFSPETKINLVIMFIVSMILLFGLLCYFCLKKKNNM